MPSIYLINVGANVGHQSQVRSPVFIEDGDRFAFLTFPHKDCTSRYLKSLHSYVKEPATSRTHLDPDWEHLTYGDNCANGRAGALRRVEVGDIFIFWALLWRIPDRTHNVFETWDRGWYLVGAMTVGHVLGPGESLSALPAEARKRALANEHIEAGRVRKADGRHDRVFVGDPRHSQLFESAVDLQVGDNFGLLRRTIFAKDGRELRWTDEGKSPRWNSALRACRAVLDLSSRGSGGLLTTGAGCGDITRQAHCSPPGAWRNEP